MLFKKEKYDHLKILLRFNHINNNATNTTNTNANININIDDKKCLEQTFPIL